MHWKDKFQAIIGVIILIAFAGALYGWPAELVSQLIAWGISILIAVFLSGICGELIENFTGDALKNISLTVSIAGTSFSVTLFFIATLALRYLLFN